MVKGTCAILLAVGLFWPLASDLLSRGTVSPAEREQLAQQFVEPENCFPEPGERRAFEVGAVLLPLSIFAFCFAARYLESRSWL
jgi:hypothetical protein